MTVHIRHTAALLDERTTFSYPFFARSRPFILIHAIKTILQHILYVSNQFPASADDFFLLQRTTQLTRTLLLYM